MRLRVLTYNIHRAIGIDRRFRPERVAAILQRYDADIVLLQEVASGAPRSRMLDLAAFLAERVQYAHHVLGLTVHLRVGRYGNATLSRFPIGRQRNIDLTLGALKRRGCQHTQVFLPLPGWRAEPVAAGVHQAADSAHDTGRVASGGDAARIATRPAAREAGRRVAKLARHGHEPARVAARRTGLALPLAGEVAPQREGACGNGPGLLIDLAAGVVPVDIFNVHLSLTARMRRRQIRHLLRLEELLHMPAEAPCIIGGDMNAWGGALKRSVFAPAGFKCATNRRPGSRWALKTYPSFAPTCGLDKIFYRGPLRLLRVQRSSLAIARIASDHLPVIADFELCPARLLR